MGKAMQQRSLGFECPSPTEREQGGKNDEVFDMEIGNQISNEKIKDAAYSVGVASRECNHITAEKAAANRAQKSELLNLIKRQNYQCAACGIPIVPSTCHLDHIRPRCDGGDDSVANLQWLCHTCNRSKGTMSMGAFVLMCKRIAERF